jgi:tRNA(Ile)-lysidine synthase
MRAISGQWMRENGMYSDGEVTLNAVLLSQEPIGLVRRILRAAFRAAGSTLKDVTFDHVEAARGLLDRGKSGKKIEIPGGLTASREFDKLVIRGPQNPASDYEYRLQIPGSVHIPELRTVFTAEIVEIEGNPDRSGRVYVDGDAIGPYVRIRNWKPGDYYQPVGLPAGKLKRLFQRARIPRSQRKSWPVLEAGESIIWVASFPVSREYVPCERSQKIVAFEALPS